ncbi:MAG: MFS transporter [Actinomyces sp.]|nr:MAG: MFS transporter [Actinomyces sp.]
MGASTLQLFALAVLAADLIDDLGVSRAQIGILGGVNTLIGAVASPAGGRLVDRIGARRGVVWVLAVSAAGLAATAAATTYVTLVLASVLAGLPQAGANAATNKLIGEHVAPGRRGVVTGIKQSGVQIAVFAAGATLPGLARLVGWRPSLAVVAVLVAGWAALAAMRLPPEVEGTGPAPAPDGRRARLDPFVWRLTVYGTLMGLAAGATGRFLPLFAHEALGYPTTVAGLTVALSGLVAIGARIWWGRAAERGLGSRRALAIMGLLGAAVGGGLVAADVALAALVWPVAVLSAVSLSSWNSVAMLAIITGTAGSDAGRASGVVLAGFLAGLAVGSPVAGWSVDATGTYDTAWVAVAVLAALAAATMRVPSRPCDDSSSPC